MASSSSRNAQPLTLSALGADDSSISSADVSFSGGPSPEAPLSIQSGRVGTQAGTTVASSSGRSQHRPPQVPASNRTPSPVGGGGVPSPTVRFSAQQQHQHRLG